MIKNKKESEPQKLPTPICPLLSLNVLGHLWAYLNYYMVDPVKICLSPSVKGAFTTVAKEQPLGELVPVSEPLSDFVPLYELNKEKGYLTTKMLFWREVQDEGNDADKVTFKPKLMHGVFKPFFPSVGKIVRDGFPWICCMPMERRHAHQKGAGRMFRGRCEYTANAGRRELC